jgi:diguanylate cyclase (GGDEF)-like protein
MSALRYLLVACLLGFNIPAAAELPVAAFEVTALPAAHGIADVADVTDGSLDARFGPYDYVESRTSAPVFWLRLRATAGIAAANTLPALRVRQGRHLTLQVYRPGADESGPLPVAAVLSAFRGEKTVLYALPDGLAADTHLYVRVAAEGRGAEALQFALAPLDEALAQGAEHARMIALTFGALMSMALAALVIWFVLQERLLLLYATLFSLQALYIAFLSGQGFDWPGLTFTRAFHAHAWNVPAALSGAAACLFAREIADLRRYSPRIYRVFGWLAIAFIVLAFANFAHLIGAGALVAPIGNLIFVGVAIFTLVVAFLAWRRGNRAAGWFLVAWGLLEIFTIATAASFLVGNAEPLVHYGLPLSMVAAAILVALGVADRLREQRLALSDAERRAQTDPLTGVLNRRSLIERLDAACRRAQARGLPIALLFIDLDHFKAINDTRGHLAGDACLKAVITPIQSELRQSDVIGRYGGEEFVVILSSADAAAAHAIAQRIRLRVAELEVNGFGPPISLTCSIGVATSDTLGVWGEHLVARADAAVYVAKNAGRNQVQVAPPAAA